MSCEKDSTSFSCTKNVENEQDQGRGPAKGDGLEESTETSSISQHLSDDIVNNFTAQDSEQEHNFVDSNSAKVTLKPKPETPSRLGGDPCGRDLTHRCLPSGIKLRGDASRLGHWGSEAEKTEKLKDCKTSIESAQTVQVTRHSARNPDQSRVSQPSFGDVTEVAEASCENWVSARKYPAIGSGLESYALLDGQDPRKCQHCGKMVSQMSNSGIESLCNCTAHSGVPTYRGVERNYLQPGGFYPTKGASLYTVARQPGVATSPASYQSNSHFAQSANPASCEGSVLILQQENKRTVHHFPVQSLPYGSLLRPCTVPSSTYRHDLSGVTNFGRTTHTPWPQIPGRYPLWPFVPGTFLRSNVGGKSDSHLFVPEPVVHPVARNTPQDDVNSTGEHTSLAQVVQAEEDVGDSLFDQLSQITDSQSAAESLPVVSGAIHPSGNTLAEQPTAREQQQDFDSENDLGHDEEPVLPAVKPDLLSGAGDSCSLDTVATKPPTVRLRTKFGEIELMFLESFFKMSHYPDRSVRLKLASILNLSHTQVKTWFQNRRQREKRRLIAIGLLACPLKQPNPRCLQLKPTKMKKARRLGFDSKKGQKTTAEELSPEEMLAFLRQSSDQPKSNQNTSETSASSTMGTQESAISRIELSFPGLGSS